MGRKPTTNQNLPPRLRARRRGDVVWYYFDAGGKPRKEIPLGKDYVLAVQKWSALMVDTKAPAVATFNTAADRYTREVIPTKAPRTQADNIKELAKLLEFFGNPPAPLSEIKPIHIRQYLDWRGATAKVRANREKALFSHIWNKAREWGYTDIPNPCAGVRGHKERGRKDIYVDDNLYAAVYQAADSVLRDAMDLAYLTGQRPSDVLKISETDIRDGYLHVSQGKTAHRLRIEITGALADLLARIKAGKDEHKVRALAVLCNERGEPLSYSTLRSRFDKAREMAGIDKALFQFKDLRAKAGTDKEEAGGIRAAQDQLGHTSEQMTAHYVRHRRGKKVTPTK